MGRVGRFLVRGLIVSLAAWVTIVLVEPVADRDPTPTIAVEVTDLALGARAPGPSGSPESTGGPADGGDDSLLRSLPPAAAVPPPPPERPIPVGLRLPAVAIDTGSVTAVGVEPDGQLEVPGPTKVGWYRFGSAPGEGGSTVLAAHIAYDGVDGVFRRLADAGPGEVVQVVLDDGTVLDYRVTDVVEYPKSELPTDALFSEAGPDRLVLITCGGDFIPAAASYDSNVVVYAHPDDRQ